MRRLFLLSVHILLLMCVPLPQSAFAAVGIGRGAGIPVAALFALYALSDVLTFALIVWGVRRMGRPGLARLETRLPRSLHGRLTGGVHVAGRGALSTPAIFAAGYANLYLAALITGLRHGRTLPAALLGIAGDLLQFGSAALLAGTAAHFVQVPGGEFTMLMIVPVLVAIVPLLIKRLRIPLPRLPRLSIPALQLGPPAPVPIPIPIHDERRVR